MKATFIGCRGFFKTAKCFFTELDDICAACRLMLLM